MIDLIIDGNVDGDVLKKCADLAKKAIETVLKCENHTFDAEISLTVTDDDEIHALNKQYRNVDSATDVLSFPLYEFETPSVFNESQTELDKDTIALGDIVISHERIKAQAKEYGNSFEREFSYMTVHSMLHLLGYDHIDETDKKLMRSREKEIMKALKID